MPGIASLDIVNNRAKGPMFKIRFNKLAMDVLDGYTHVQMYKAKEYILIKPVTTATDRNIYYINRHNSTASINVGRLVSIGFFDRALFGKKYAVKKDRKGNLFICLNEEIKGEGNP